MTVWVVSSSGVWIEEREFSCIKMWRDRDVCSRVVQHARANAPRVGVGAGERDERERGKKL